MSGQVKTFYLFVGAVSFISFYVIFLNGCVTPVNCRTFVQLYQSYSPKCQQKWFLLQRASSQCTPKKIVLVDFFLR